MLWLVPTVTKPQTSNERITENLIICFLAGPCEPASVKPVLLDIVGHTGLTEPG